MFLTVKFKTPHKTELKDSFRLLGAVDGTHLLVLAAG